MENASQRVGVPHANLAKKISEHGTHDEPREGVRQLRNFPFVASATAEEIKWNAQALAESRTFCIRQNYPGFDIRASRWPRWQRRRIKLPRSTGIHLSSSFVSFDWTSEVPGRCGLRSSFPTPVLPR